MDTYTIPFRIYQLEVVNAHKTHINNKEVNSQPSSINAQIKKKVRMNDKGCTKGYASEESMHQRKKIRALNEEQVIRQLIACVPLLINEVKFSIYRFLVLRTKNNIKMPHPVELQFDRLTSRWALNAQLVTVGPQPNLNWEYLALDQERSHHQPRMKPF